MRHIVTLLLLVFLVRATKAQETLYDLDSIQKIEIFFSAPDWNHQLHVLKLTTDGYLKSDSVRINGFVFPNSGVKYKGNSSYDSTWLKNPLHIGLDKFQNQDYQGFEDIKLSNCYMDPSMIREVLSYKILGDYMECPRANFAQVYINNQYFGLYSNIEDVGKSFCAKRFRSNKNNTFIKGNPIVNPGPAVKSNLKFLGSDSSAYLNYYELKSTIGWNQLVNLCNTASNNPSQLPNMLDMDRTIWMLAFDNVLVNLDSYMGAFAQNYYLFKDNNGFFNPVVWDLNMSFGAFPFAGSSNTSLGTLSIANIKQFPISVHLTDPYWPIINAIQANDRYKKMYHAHIRTLVNEVFTNSAYDTLAVHLQAQINTAVVSDTNKFFTTSQFHNSLTADISGGNYLIPGIRTMMNARTSYLLARPEISSLPPAITSVSASYEAISGTSFVSASVANHSDTAVYMGYRLSNTQKFQRIRMWDDGQHQDGNAGDGIFAASFPAAPATSEFYVYAENASASVFSPERAEFEFHTFSTFVANQPKTRVNEMIAFYPNPSTGILKVVFTQPAPQILEIQNTIGQQVWENTIRSGEQIRLENLPGGVYFLKIAGQTLKWIVSK